MIAGQQDFFFFFSSFRGASFRDAPCPSDQRHKHNVNRCSPQASRVYVERLADPLTVLQLRLVAAFFKNDRHISDRPSLAL